MIIRDRQHPLKMLLALRGSIIPTIAPQILVIAAIASLVAGLNRFYPGRLPVTTTAPFTFLGLTLSIFLGFRNNACYDRWWEGRKQWGLLIVEMRSLARELTSLLDRDEPGRGSLCRDGSDPQARVALRIRAGAHRDRLLRHAIGFTHSLVAHLRDQPLGPVTAAFFTEAELAGARASRNAPDYVLRLMGTELAACHREGLLSDILFMTVEARLTAIAGVQASCERIRNTPLPFAYTLLLHRTAYIFCALLPFGLVTALGDGTPLVAALVAYTFFGLDALGDELEEPFGLRPNDLPLSALARTIEINLREAMGETDLPLSLQPDDYLLQ